MTIFRVYTGGFSQLRALSAIFQQNFMPPGDLTILDRDYRAIHLAATLGIVSKRIAIRVIPLSSLPRPVAGN